MVLGCGPEPKPWGSQGPRFRRCRAPENPLVGQYSAGSRSAARPPPSGLRLRTSHWALDVSRGMSQHGALMTLFISSLWWQHGALGALRPVISGDSSPHMVPDYHDDERNVFCESRLGPACRGSRC